jgi:hypothetical protein
MTATTLTVMVELFTVMFKWGAVPTLICLLVSESTQGMKEQKTNLLVGYLNIHCCCISYCDNPV